MCKNNAVKLTGRDTITNQLTVPLNIATRLLICPTLATALQELLTEHSDRRTERGMIDVVHNGCFLERSMQVSMAAAAVKMA